MLRRNARAAFRRLRFGRIAATGHATTDGVSLPPDRRILSAWVGPVQTAGGSPDPGSTVVGEVDGGDAYRWWTVCDPALALLGRLVTTSSRRRKGLAKDLEVRGCDDLYALHQVLSQGSLRCLRDELRPMTQRPIHPFRYHSRYQRFRGLALTVPPVAFAFFTCAFGRDPALYDAFAEDLAPEVVCHHTPENLRAFLEAR